MCDLPTMQPNATDTKQKNRKFVYNLMKFYDGVPPFVSFVVGLIWTFTAALYSLGLFFIYQICKLKRKKH